MILVFFFVPKNIRRFHRLSISHLSQWTRTDLLRVPYFASTTSRARWPGVSYSISTGKTPRYVWSGPPPTLYPTFAREPARPLKTLRDPLYATPHLAQPRVCDTTRTSPVRHVHATRLPNLSTMQDKWSHGSTRGYANLNTPLHFTQNLGFPWIFNDFTRR